MLDRIDAIRDSYKRLKDQCTSPRILNDPAIRAKYGEGAFLPGDVSFNLKHPEPDFSESHTLGHILMDMMRTLPGPPTSMTLEEFMRPDTFKSKSDESSPLAIVMVSTEYWEYDWVDISESEGIFAVKGEERNNEELVRFFKETSNYLLPRSEVSNLRLELDGIFSSIPLMQHR